MTDIITEDTVLPTPIEPTISGLVTPPAPGLPLAAHDGEKAQLIQNATHAVVQLEKWILGNVPVGAYRDDAVDRLASVEGLVFDAITAG
jgi:hypothetical protein